MNTQQLTRADDAMLPTVLQENTTPVAIEDIVFPKKPADLMSKEYVDWCKTCEDIIKRKEERRCATVPAEERQPQVVFTMSDPIRKGQGLLSHIASFEEPTGHDARF
jgi:hypothetical protein